MTMSFRHDKQKKARRQKLLGALLLFTLLFIVFRASLTNGLSSVFFKLFRPVLSLEYAATEWLKEGAALIASKESLAAQNEQLKEALDLVSLEAYSREELKMENEQLKAMFGRSSGRSLLLARVLATPGRSPYDTLLLDAGIDEGLAPGMKVFVDGDFVIGEVTKVMRGGALVTLYSSYGNELPVTVGSSSVPAIAKGAGGGNFRISLPKSVSVSPGDLVHIPAIAPTYAAVVSAIDRDEESSLEKVYLKWPFNVNGLTWVYVATTLTALDSAKKKNE